MAMRAEAPAPLRVIRTKVLPPVHRNLVPRPGLTEPLGASETSKVTLICAPAGFGKSSLLAAWAEASWEERPFAWFAIDGADNDPKRFWAYAIESLRGVDAAIGVRSAEMLRAPGPPLLDLMILELINEIAAADRRTVLALDDYHVITDPEIHQSVTLLVEHLPAELHLAVTARSEPPLPLARWRGRGELIELDAARLRFSPEEAEAFLNDLLGLGLDRAEVATLQERTEGWPAGLYLAALSVRGRANRQGFITQFAGTDRYVVDYLGEEVLRGQPEDVRAFMLRTSVLERLCAPLCDAVTGTAMSARMLREIERSNLFLIPLDTKREWYRYHHLFRDLLAHEVQAHDASLLPELHRRAAQWLLEAGFTSDGIHHMIAAGDVDHACELIAAHWAAFLGVGDDRTIAAWLDSLPGDAVMGDARVCVAGAMAALSLNRLDEVGEWVRKAECASQPGPSADGFGSVTPAIAFVRASHGLATGDLVVGRSAAQQAVALLPETSPWRQLALCTLGLAAYLLGRDSEGADALEEAQRIGRIAGMGLNLDLVLGSLAVIRADHGQLEEARQLAGEALAGAAGSALEHWGYGHAHLAQAMVLEQLGHLAEADAEAVRALELMRRGWPIFLAVGLPAQASIKHGLGDRPAARALLGEARRIVSGCPSPGIVPQLIDATERRIRTAPSRRAAGPVAEPLTGREITILRMLAGDLSQREIGQQLFVTVNTVKFHTRSVFRKLAVSTRAEAVARARELDLL